MGRWFLLRVCLTLSCPLKEGYHLTGTTILSVHTSHKSTTVCLTPPVMASHTLLTTLTLTSTPVALKPSQATTDVCRHGIHFWKAHIPYTIRLYKLSWTFSNRHLWQRSQLLFKLDKLKAAVIESYLVNHLNLLSIYSRHTLLTVMIPIVAARNNFTAVGPELKIQWR